jgi:hypothetical protein
MERGSKYNTFKCPECNYGATRKYNLQVHLLRVHGLNLSPYAFETQREWLWSQRRALERSYIEAETELEKKQSYDRLYNFLVNWGRKGHWHFINAISDAWSARRKHEEMAAQLKAKSDADIK